MQYLCRGKKINNLISRAERIRLDELHIRAHVKTEENKFFVARKNQPCISGYDNPVKFFTIALFFCHETCVTGFRTINLLRKPDMKKRDELTHSLRKN
jgi:hypothetical protein